MATLKVLAYAGVATLAGSQVEIVDGGPIAFKTITTGDTLPGSDAAPALVKLVPIGGDVDLTWPNGISEPITAPEFRRVRGEAVTVA